MCTALRTRAYNIPQTSGYVIPNTMIIPDGFSTRLSYAASLQTSSRTTFSAPSSSSTCRLNNNYDTYNNRFGRIPNTEFIITLLLRLRTPRTTISASSSCNRWIINNNNIIIITVRILIVTCHANDYTFTRRSVFMSVDECLRNSIRFSIGIVPPPPSKHFHITTISTTVSTSN